MQTLNVGEMAKPDIGDHSGYEFRCALLFVQPFRSTFKGRRAGEPVPGGLGDPKSEGSRGR